MEVRQYIQDNILIFDGAMGTMLQKKGLQVGENTEVFGYENPDILVDIHKEYYEAGSNVATTNTFGCNELKLPQGYDLEKVIDSAVKAAKKAASLVNNDNEKYVALDIGPIGEMLEPMGTLSFDRAYEIFKRQMIQGEKSGADIIVIETMMDLYEIKAALLAAKENTNLPVFCTMTFDENGRSFTGCLPESMVVTLQGLGADAVGVNCSLGPDLLLPIVEKILTRATIPVMVQANAGLPCIKCGEAVYDMTAEQFLSGASKFVKMGAKIIGGCCGTNPEFIKALSQNIKNLEVKPIEKNLECVVCSPSKIVEITGPTVMGERLNPTGKKKLKAALKEERYDELVVEAIKQEQAGAHVLDVNVGLPGIDEPKVMKHVIKLLQEVIQLPLQIDSSNFQAIEEACRYYNGKPLINSVNGKDETMEAVFPVVKKYGGVVIGLALDENGIPPKAEQRFEIAKKIINKAKEYGIDKKDIIIDCLVLTASAQQKEVMETVKAVSMVKTLGVHTVLGVSNVSFGLPNRPLLNKTFLAMAMSAGLDLPIINPLDQELMNTIDAFNVLYNYDRDATNYIQKQAQNQVVLPKQTTSFSLNDVVLHGLKDEVKKATETALESQDGLTIVNDILIPALDQIGKDYETGKIFLPQLIQSAEASKIAFDVIKQTFKTTKSSKGPVLIATVHGDIHDIGKNIVKVVLESYGYQVIDLGKDVPAEVVLEAYHKHHPKAIGLSALMTTTVVSMEETITLLKQEENMCPIFVGGAVLTEDIAQDIHADHYTKDAMAAVNLLNEIVH